MALYIGLLVVRSRAAFSGSVSNETSVTAEGATSSSLSTGAAACEKRKGHGNSRHPTGEMRAVAMMVGVAKQV